MVVNLAYSVRNILNKYTYNFAGNWKKCCVFLLMGAFFLIYQRLFVFLLFVALDFVASYLDLKYKIDLGTDYIVTGMIIFSHALGLIYGLWFIPFHFFTRIVLGKLKRKHFLKLPCLLLIPYLAGAFSSTELGTLGFFLFLMRYVLEYMLSFLLFRDIEIRRIPRRLLHLLGGYFILSKFGQFIVEVIK